MLQESTQHEWVRIDGKMETNMPDANLGSSSIETAKHGNVLWVKLDKDAYRIGYALTPELRAKYPQGLTQEQAVEEAIESLKPFNLAIPRVDWWTSYSVIQGVAATMQKDNFVLLAGDAAHVHSSGFAQGMNTGVHDATNLIWKLAGTIKGWYNPFVLTSYDSERRPIAHKLIEMDKLASDAISGNIPIRYRELVAKEANADDIVTKIYSENVAFVSGLGISYALSLINHEPLSGTVMAGHRAPDAVLKQPGRRITIRLFDVTRAYGRWSILVFGGYHTVTQSKLITLRDQLLADKTGLATRYFSVLKLSTIIAGSTSSAWEVFDGPGMGKLYFDPEGAAHCLYGVSLNSGAVVVIRPDGIMGFATALNESDKLEEYFKGFCL
ncbi:pentachlorophenol 4-monooxygenase [Colletotrichum tofieldiae]|nr:pentachlorophenol 4-monooxygenase [Colletotrichum tofieldiae]GKT72864.1 pentachlorophenol 4-monooxygenase [Colletotrichum tofieldiae]